MAKAKKQAPDTASIEVDALTPDEAAGELKRLPKLIAYHDKRHHQQGAPEISDAEYDALVRRNPAIEAGLPARLAAGRPAGRRRAPPAAGRPTARPQRAGLCA